MISHAMVEADRWFDLADRSITIPVAGKKMNDVTLFTADAIMATEGEDCRDGDLLDDGPASAT